MGKGTKEAYDIIRKSIKYYDVDRVMYLDINCVEQLIKDNVIVEKVEKLIGGLL